MVDVGGITRHSPQGGLEDDVHGVARTLRRRGSSLRAAPHSLPTLFSRIPRRPRPMNVTPIGLDPGGTHRRNGPPRHYRRQRTLDLPITLAKCPSRPILCTTMRGRSGTVSSVRRGTHCQSGRQTTEVDRLLAPAPLFRASPHKNKTGISVISLTALQSRLLRVRYSQNAVARQQLSSEMGGRGDARSGTGFPSWGLLDLVGRTLRRVFFPASRVIFLSIQREAPFGRGIDFLRLFHLVRTNEQALHFSVSELRHSHPRGGKSGYSPLLWLRHFTRNAVMETLVFNDQSQYGKLLHLRAAELPALWISVDSLTV